MGTSFAAVLYRPADVSERALSHGFGVAVAGFDVAKPSLLLGELPGVPGWSVAFYRSGAAKGGTDVTFGDWGLQALEPAYVTNRQIESARIAINRHIKRGGKVWINIYPDRPLTKKPAETRMGSGKGSPEWWVANVKPGRVMFELTYPDETAAREALTRAAHKLPMKCRIVRREVSED